MSESKARMRRELFDLGAQRDEAICIAADLYRVIRDAGVDIPGHVRLPEWFWRVVE